MNKLLFTILCSIILIGSSAQAPKDSSWKKQYRETATRVNDLVNTKLELKPDFSKSYLYGKAWITLKPHFYSTDSLSLDAKGMDIKELSILKGNQHSPLKYNYDGSTLSIHLDKTYRYSENYTVYIVYTSKPNELKA